MYRLILPAIACLLTVSCQTSSHRSGAKVLIGATVITARGATPIEDAVIVVSGNTIRAVGIRKDVPIPQDTERTDLAGKWIVPVGDGRIAPGEQADLVILNASPSGAVPAVDAPVSRRLIHGQWN